MNPLKQEIHTSEKGSIALPEEDAAKKRYCFQPDFIGFSGHFPENSVLPAVVQILLAAWMTEEYAGGPLEILSVEKAKFHIPLHPLEEIEVACRYRRIRGRLWCEARLSVSEGTASTFRISFFETGGGK